MANGYPPAPNDLALTVTGRPWDAASWRTAALPPTHAPPGYTISQDDADRIVAIILQQVNPLVAATPDGEAEAAPPADEPVATAPVAVAGEPDADDATAPPADDPDDSTTTPGDPGKGRRHR